MPSKGELEGGGKTVPVLLAPRGQGGLVRGGADNKPIPEKRILRHRGGELSAADQ